MNLYFCPKCQSGKIDGFEEEGELVLPTRAEEELGNDVRCLDCGWEGKQVELLYMAREAHLKGQDLAEETVKQLVSELLVQLHERASEPISFSLAAVGLVIPNELKREYKKREKDPDLYTPQIDLTARLVRAGVVGAWKGIIEEMKAIEKITEEAKRDGKRPDYKLQG